MKDYKIYDHFLLTHIFFSIIMIENPENVLKQFRNSSWLFWLTTFILGKIIATGWLPLCPFPLYIFINHALYASYIAIQPPLLSLFNHPPVSLLIKESLSHSGRRAYGED